jgi:hypothetical protein
MRTFTSRAAVPPDRTSLQQQLFHSPVFCSRARNLSPSTDADFTFRDYYIDETLVRQFNEQNLLEIKCDAV